MVLERLHHLDRVNPPIKQHTPNVDPLPGLLEDCPDGVGFFAFGCQRFDGNGDPKVVGDHAGSDELEGIIGALRWVRVRDHVGLVVAIIVPIVNVDGERYWGGEQTGSGGERAEFVEGGLKLPGDLVAIELPEVMAHDPGDRTPPVRQKCRGLAIRNSPRFGPAVDEFAVNGAIGQ